MSNQTSIELQKDGRTLTLYVIRLARKSIYNDLRDLEKLGIEVEGEPVGK